MVDDSFTNVSLPPEQEAFVDGLVAAGRYQTVNDVVLDGLRLLEEAEQRRLAQKWLVEGLSEEELSQLSLELRQELQNQVYGLVVVAQQDVEAGRIEDGTAVMKDFETQLQSRPE